MCDISSRLINYRAGRYANPGVPRGTCRLLETIPYSRSIRKLKIKVILVILKYKDIDLWLSLKERECHWCYQQ